MSIENLKPPKTPAKRGRPAGRRDSAQAVAMREIMRLSLSRLGGAKAMVDFYNESAENRRTFWGIAGRMLPLEVSGPGGEALKVELSWLDGRGIGKTIDMAEAADVTFKALEDAGNPASLVLPGGATDLQSVSLDEPGSEPSEPRSE